MRICPLNCRNLNPPPCEGNTVNNTQEALVTVANSEYFQAHPTVSLWSWSANWRADFGFCMQVATVVLIYAVLLDDSFSVRDVIGCVTGDLRLAGNGWHFGWELEFFPTKQEKLDSSKCVSKLRTGKPMWTMTHSVQGSQFNQERLMLKERPFSKHFRARWTLGSSMRLTQRSLSTKHRYVMVKERLRRYRLVPPRQDGQLAD